MIESKQQNLLHLHFYSTGSFFFNRQAWISLGKMSKEQAMEEYIKLLFDRCSIFRIYLQNQHDQTEEKDRLR
jgi:hypothetical protein